MGQSGAKSPRTGKDKKGVIRDILSLRMASENLAIPISVIPTVETKITLAGELDVPPIGRWMISGEGLVLIWVFGKSWCS